MSDLYLWVLGVIGVISAGVAGVVSVKRSAAKAEQMQSAKEATEAVLKSTQKQLQAERTVNKEVQDVQAEVLSSTDSAVRARLQRWTK